MSYGLLMKIVGIIVLWTCVFFVSSSEYIKLELNSQPDSVFKSVIKGIFTSWNKKYLYIYIKVRFVSMSPVYDQT